MLHKNRNKTQTTYISINLKKHNIGNVSQQTVSQTMSPISRNMSKLMNIVDIVTGADLQAVKGLNMQLEVLGWVEKRNYLESAVQMKGILSDLLLWTAERPPWFGTQQVLRLYLWIERQS